MKRRDFLLLRKEDKLLSKINYSLDKYQGEWNSSTASHLLRRALFSFTIEQADQVVADGLDKTINKMLTESKGSPHPVYMYKDTTGISYGQDLIGINYPAEANRKVINSFIARWVGNMLEQGISLTEKMLLFWHNLFATESYMIGNPYYNLSYYQLLRDESLGNYKSLTEKMTINTAMLVYLNGNANIIGKPNENYARELLELFTIGKGKQIADGNYTNYTEDDIMSAAKVLTGWTTPRTSNDSAFDTKRHDKSNKQFSSAFDNKVISNNEDKEYKDLVKMILDKKETAKNICRELYRWFVYYEINDETEKNIIEPLGNIFYNNNYEVKPVLEKLFSSQHFFDVNNYGNMIKNPYDYLSSLIKHFEIDMPIGDTQDNLAVQSLVWYSIVYGEAVKQDMILADPPSVAGWPAYYQAPVYYRTWLSSVTLQNRMQASDTLISTKGTTRNGFKIIIDPLKFTKKLNNPKDALELVEEAAHILYPFEITNNQKSFLMESLLGSIPEYEWTTKWEAYLKNPSDKKITDELNNKLRNLYKTMMSLAEFHLM